MTDWYTKTGLPATDSPGSSLEIRTEFAAIETAMQKLPAYTGNGDLAVFINSAGTGAEAVSAAVARLRLGIGTTDNPTFGVVTATGFTIGSASITEAELEILNGATLTTTELNYVDGVTSAIQTQIDNANAAINLKAALASPTFTGTVTLPTATAIGSVSATEIGYVNGVTGAIQPQLDLKAALDAPTFTGIVTLPSTTSIGNVSATEIGYLDNVTSAIQTQLNAKAALAGPTFSGTVTLPSTTAIGSVSSTELGYLNNVTSAIQTQLNAKAASSHNHTASEVTSGTFADARISESSVTQHQAALTITESQISDLTAAAGIYGAYKASDTTRTSTTTTTADPELTISSVPIGIYTVTGMIELASNTTADFKFQFTTTGTINNRDIVLMSPQNGASYDGNFAVHATTSDTQLPFLPGGGSIKCAIYGYLNVSVSGDITFEWAQNTSDAGNTTVYRYSNICLSKIG